MDRRTQIERIITGSLIADFRHYWPDVRTTVDEGMILDPLCREVFSMMDKMHARGITPNVKNVAEDHRWTQEQFTEILSLAIDNDFETSRCDYNLMCAITDKPRKEVTFEQYITQLLRYETDRQRKLRDRQTT